jgi:hypothetical protein
VFFTLEVILCFLYVRRWKLSPVFSYGFALFLVNDSLGTLCVYANMYLTVMPLVPAPQWPVPVLLLSTALSALIEQIYMVVCPSVLPPSPEALIIFFGASTAIGSCKCPARFSVGISCDDSVRTKNTVWSAFLLLLSVTHVRVSVPGFLGADLRV